MKINILFQILAIFLIVNCTIAQSVTSNSVQDSLSKLSSLIWKQKSDSARIIANEIFFKKFHSVLESESSANITLDSIKGITRVESDDGKLRIYTWNIPLTSGSNKYFGFILRLNSHTEVIPLRSDSNVPADFETTQLAPLNWYGAIYYKLIQVEISGQKVYTLLGWDGHTANSNKKLIDIISRDKAGNIVFGLPVFKTDQGIKCRVVKEYAEKANMLLRYDYQSINVKRRNRIKKENTWLIVMDRLVPMDPSLKGMSKFYVSSGDTYDGYLFKNGFWVLVEDIEVANREVLTK